MSSTTNIGVLNAMKSSTAAIKVSFTGKLKADGKTAQSFDSILGQLNAGKEKTEVVKSKAENVSTKDVKNDTSDINKTTDNQEVKTTTNTDNANLTQKPVNTKETDGKEADNELQSAISEDGKKLIKEIAEAVEVSEDEILMAMQVLGLTEMNLLNPENILQVVNQVNNGDDGTMLIVDQNLFTNIKDVLSQAKEMVSELTEEFDIPKENLVEVIKSEGNHVSGKEIFASAEVVEKVEETVDPKLAIKTDDDKLLKTEIKPEQVQEKETIETTFKPIEESAESSKNNQNNLMHHEHQTNPFNQIVENIVDAAVDTANPVVNPYTDRAQMEDIIRQITDRITISKGPEETSMELSLHPANLGHVNILLTNSKEGIVAKFTAQNEIVKEAVESQMVKLQQKFDEQGIKVTSIEVTIASHAFEQNLQQDQNRNAQEQMAKSRKSLRRINLSGLMDEEEEIDEGDALIKEMMTINGNSVDFSA